MDVRLLGWSDLRRSLCVVLSWLVAGLLGVAAAPGQDETPVPLPEIVTGQTDTSGLAFVTAEGGDRLLFWADDGRRGRELWITDGTESGTRLWTEVCPGDCRGDAKNGVRFEDVVFDGTRAFFVADDGIHGREVWTYDGSGDGPRRVTDICSGSCDAVIENLSLVDGRAYFGASSDDSNVEPWVSDGTPEGTHPLGDLVPGDGSSSPRFFLKLGDRVAFFAGTETLRPEWWATDGTPEGTVQLTDLCRESCSTTGMLAMSFEDGVLFARTGSLEFNLYRLSSAGSLQQLETLCEGSHCGIFEGFMLPVGERVYVTRDNKLWSTDGTAAGTRVEVFLPNAVSRVLDVEILADGTLLVLGDKGDANYRVYRKVGSSLGELVFTGSFRLTMHNLGDRAILVDPNSSGIDLWSTDGTAQGTDRYSRLDSEWAISALVFSTVIGDQVVITSRLGSGVPTSAEIVATGGPQEALRKLWEIEPRPASLQPDQLTSVGSRIVFREVDGDRDKDDLWSIDELGNAQRLVSGVEPEDLVTVRLAEGTRAFFASGDDFDSRTPWLSDGTEDGTFALNDPAGSLLTWGREPVVLNGQLFFLADQGRGQKLWRSGVEEDSVELVADLRTDYQNVHVGCGICGPPITATPIFPRQLHVVGQGANARLVFVGGQEESGAELWQSDGTEEGTSLLFDLVPGEVGSEPEHLIPAGQGLIFTADVGQGPERFLWDGQSTSPQALDRDQEIWATAHNAARAVWIERHEEGHFGIVTSDGTRSGTRYPVTLPANTIPERSIVLYDERLFFVASDNVGSELRVVHLDRVGADVVQRFDLWPGRRGSFPGDLRLLGDQLYFSADNGISGRELWRLDAQARDLQPVRLGDVAPGLEPSSPRAMALLESSLPDAPGGDEVVFSADDGLGGRELWAVPFVGNAASCQTDATALCLREGRFRVTVDWRDEINGTEGVGHVSAAGAETGFFWFFEPNNLELTVKIIDGRDFNEAHWVFYGALSDVAYDITVEDLATGARRIYSNPQGNFCGRGDIEAFPETDAADLGFPKLAFPEVPGTSMVETSDPSKIGTCTSDFRRHCLLDRFEVTVDWTDHDGNSGIGQAGSSNGQTGLFWFFNQDNIELAVKAIDGTEFNDSFWIFYGALTDVRYTLRVVDTVTGNEVAYENPAGNLCGRGDTSAFPTMP